MWNFFEYRKNKMSIPLFNIYCATGSNREYYAERTAFDPAGTDHAGHLLCQADK